MKNTSLVLSTLALFSLLACGGDSGNNPGKGDESSSTEGSSSVIPASSGVIPASSGISSSGVTPISTGNSSSSKPKPNSSGVNPTSSSVKPVSSGVNPTSSSVIPVSSGISSSTISTPSSSGGAITSFTDPRDGQVYPVVTIGTQVWFAKNLNVGTMVEWDGNQLHQILAVNDAVIEKMCNGNNPANCTKYGGLYQWYEAIQYPAMCAEPDNWIAGPPDCPHGNLPNGKRGVCPMGWHIPDTTEFNVLFQYVRNHGYPEGVDIALRSSALFSGIDAFGFNVLGGGAWNSGWRDLAEEGYLWTSTLDYDICGTTCARYNNWDHNNDFTVVHDTDLSLWDALSIRCLKD